MNYPAKEIKGVVKWFDQTKGIGFIQTAEGIDIFVHYSALTNQNDNFKSLQAEQTVVFDVEKGRRGPQAANVRVVE